MEIMNAQNIPRHSIGKVAKQLGVSTASVRHWERIGILPPPRKTPGGQRRYSDNDIQTILDIVMGAPQ